LVNCADARAIADGRANSCSAPEVDFGTARV
jgi:hypothetical protein